MTDLKAIRERYKADNSSRYQYYLDCGELLKMVEELEEGISEDVKEFLRHDTIKKQTKRIAELESQLDAVRNYTNTSCDTVSRSFLVGCNYLEQSAGARVANGIFKAINSALNGEDDVIAKT